MPEDEPEYLTDIIFQRPLKQQLQFELGFAPLLATVVGLMTPGGIRGAIVIAVVVSLVVIAFLRWLTFTGRFANEELFIEQTVRPVELCAIIGVVQVFHYGATRIDQLVSLSVAETTTLLAIIGTVLFIVFAEFLFHTYQLGWGSLFYLRYRNAIEKTGDLNSAEDVIEQIESVGALFGLLVATVLGRMYMEVGYYVLRNAIPDRRDEYIDELHEFVQKVENVKSRGRNLGIVGTFAISAVVVLPVFGGVAWGLSLVFGTFGSLVLALITMRVTKHIVGFSYIAFGTLRFDQFITTNKRSIGLLAGYTAVVYLLFFAPVSM
jgi:hypothetical protein